MGFQKIEIYTDGSCNTQNNYGAWASIILLDGEETVLTGECADTTHNRMEMLAVIESIKYFDDKRIQGEFIIYTDSQYVAGIPRRKEKLKQNHFITKKGMLLQNSDLLQTLIQQMEMHNIQFVKVKAHCKADIGPSKYNSQADKLSRRIVRAKSGLDVG